MKALENIILPISPQTESTREEESAELRSEIKRGKKIERARDLEFCDPTTTKLLESELKQHEEEGVADI